MAPLAPRGLGMSRLYYRCAGPIRQVWGRQSESWCGIGGGCSAGKGERPEARIAPSLRASVSIRAGSRPARPGPSRPARRSACRWWSPYSEFSCGRRLGRTGRRGWGQPRFKPEHGLGGRGGGGARGGGPPRRPPGPPPLGAYPAKTRRPGRATPAANHLCQTATGLD
jgi:hypothetical protein